MALDIVVAVASKIAEYAVAPIGRQLGYVIFYRSNVDSLKTQLQTLEAAKGTLQQRVDAAEQNGEEIFQRVQTCLVKAGGTVVEAYSLQNNEGHARVGCSCGSFPNLWIRHQLSRKATKMAMEMSHVITQVNEAINMDNISSLPRLPVAFTPFARGYKALDSRTAILNAIVQELKDDNVYVIGVHGMGGVGKSTLIKQVAWQAERDDSFGAVIVATVTSSPNVKRIQNQLAEGLGLKFNEESEEGRARRLWDRIRKENKILVIMDDIWKKIDLTQVGVPLGDDHRGCKLLLTSRDLNVLRGEMGTQTNFRLETLSEEESWNLLEKTAGDVVKDIRIQPIAIEVARACKGLPLLLITVSKALKNQSLYAWKDALIQLRKYDHEGLPSIANEAIELSYKYLASDEHKSLFLLIGSYGQKYGYTENLLIRGWCLDLFKNVESLTDARNKLYKLIDDLKASSLILEREGEREWVRMHDIICEVASKIASRVQPIFRMQISDELKEWPKMDLLQNCKHIFLPWCYMHELPECLECPELEILLICSQDNYLKVPNQFLSRMRDLKYLELGGMMCTPSLPPSLHLLKNLRALYLYQCILEDITVVSELTGLDILSLECSEIQELPKEIRQLTHLRLLNLGNCTRLRLIPANLISSLTSLEELYVGNCHIQWEVEGRDQHNNASLGELRHLHHLKVLELQIHDASIMPRDLLNIFGKLDRYKILIGDCWKWSWQDSGNFETSRILKLNLSSTTITYLDRGLKILLNGVEDLSLAELKGVRNVIPDLNGEGFPQLKNLLIQNSAEMLYILDLTQRVYPHHPFLNLESLIIRNLLHLEKICCGQLPSHIFTKLQVIKVAGCDWLKNLFSISMTKNLPKLLEIEISECKFMTNVIVVQGQEEFDDNAKINFPKVHSIKLECLPNLVSFSSQQWTTNIQSGSDPTKHWDNLSNPLSLFDQKVAISNLETLKLSSINMVKLWDDTSVPSCFQNLTHLTVDTCSSLKYLFSSSVGTALVKLRYLMIANCQLMENIFVLDSKLGNLHLALKPLTREKVTLPNLETLVVSHMDNLKSVYHDDMAPNPFPKLIKMEISFCQKMLNVFPSHVLNNLHTLETLIVSNCATLEIVFETQELNNVATSQGKVATQLKTLTLKCLPMLKQIWKNDPHDSLQFQNLCIVEAAHCESLNHVFPLSVTMELLKLQELDIRDCGVESIVAMGEMVEEDPRFVFPELASLTFWNLEELKCFYPRIHILDCPVIKKLDVYHCDELQVFKPKFQNYEEADPFHGQPLFSLEKVISSIEEFSLSSNDVTSICNGERCDDYLYAVKTLCLQCFHEESNEFPMDFLQRFTNLENLNVECSSFKEIFSSENADIIIKLKALKLSGLGNLEYLCKDKSKIHPFFQNLETLEVYWCSRLKNIVHSLSSELFQNLDKLWVGNCSGLANIITSSAARSLLKLRQLVIYNCGMIEEIVASEDEGDEGVIAFMKLEHLELQNLPRLTSFFKGNFSFEFPLLQTLYVIKCPKMETFSNGILSTPKLRRVQVTDYEVGEWHWEGELNATIRKFFNEKDPDEA